MESLATAIAMQDTVVEVVVKHIAELEQEQLRFWSVMTPEPLANVRIFELNMQAVGTNDAI